jgi:ATP-dependent Clp protease ATP-binding subunit ClpA
MTHLSESIKNKISKLSVKYDNLFDPKFAGALKRCTNSKSKKVNKENYNKIVSQLPIGIYKDVKEIITVIDEKTTVNVSTSAQFSTIAFNNRDFNACKTIDYYKGNIITGRDKEVGKLTDIMCRKDKRGVILVGEAGVGKTAIVHVLDSRLKEATVPRLLRGCCIHNMDVPYIFTKYKEDPLGAIIRVLEAANKDDKHILFIDEVHQLLSQRMNDVLKPYLTGKLRFIGATTIDEYHSIVNTDKALERRFNVIYVDEPTVAETTRMIDGTKSVYEKYHKCTIPSDVCSYLVKTGNRFMGHRKNPDKSLDILDVAGTLMNTTEIQRRMLPESDVDKFTTIESGRNAIMSIATDVGKRELTEHHIDLSISELTGIDYGKIRNSLNYRFVIENVKKKVFGQDSAIEEISNIVNIIKHIDTNNSRPLSTILLVSTAGCGKATIAKKLAELIYGSDKNFIDCDLSGLTSSHQISELKGSPPGYVGYGKSGRLIKDIKNNSQSIIYFRNANVCHEDILNYLTLGIKNGKLIGGDDQEARLNNAIVIFSITLSDNKMRDVLKKKTSMGFGKAVEGSTATNIEKVISKKIIDTADSIITLETLDKGTIEKIYDDNVNIYLEMFRGVDINLKALKREVLKESKNGHDVINKLSAQIPKMIFKSLKKE